MKKQRIKAMAVDKKTEKFINETFAKNIPILQSRLATWNIKDPKVFVELATATSIMNVDEIMNGIELAGSPLFSKNS